MADAPLPVRVVAGSTTTDEAGRQVDVLPVRTVLTEITTDAAGRQVAAQVVSIEAGLTALDGAGRPTSVQPVREVAGATTTDAAGRQVDVLPIYAGGVPPVEVPLDWRMPVSAAYDSAANGTLVSGMAASSTAKTLPEFTVAVGATRTVALKLPAGGAGFIYYQHSGNGPNVTVTAAVSADTTDGLTDGDWTALTAGLRGPSVASADAEAKKNFNGQWINYPASAVERVVRMTVAVSGSATGASTIRVGTFQRLAKMDSVLVCSMSIYALALQGDDMRTNALADFPTRDPITFNWSVSGSTSAQHLTAATEALAADIPISAMVCAVGMNGSAGSFASETTTTLNNNLRDPQRSIKAACDAAGIEYYLQRESWRSRGDVNLYNDAVIDPLILELSPSIYDATYAIGRGDTYTPIRESPALLTDGTHPGATGEVVFRSAFFDAPYRAFVGLSFPEAYVSRSVGTAETNATVKATALTSYNAALANVADLPASAGKTALSARLAAINATALFYEAVRLIDVAVAAVTQPTKDAAQTGLNAAVSAGYSGGTAPNTVAAQQARITAIVVAAYDQTVNVAFGTAGSPVTGWNRLAPGTSTGVIASGLLDASGATTALGLNVTDAGTNNSSNTALNSAIADVPSAVLSHTWSETNTGITVEITGYDPARLYTLQLMASRTTASVAATRFTVNGVVLTPDVNAQNNVSQIAIAQNVAPSAGGVITVRASRGTGSSFAHFTVLRSLRQA